MNIFNSVASSVSSAVSNVVSTATGFVGGYVNQVKMVMELKEKQDILCIEINSSKFLLNTVDVELAPKFSPAGIPIVVSSVMIGEDFPNAIACHVASGLFEEHTIILNKTVLLCPSILEAVILHEEGHIIDEMFPLIGNKSVTECELGADSYAVRVGGAPVALSLLAFHSVLQGTHGADPTNQETIEISRVRTKALAATLGLPVKV